MQSLVRRSSRALPAVFLAAVAGCGQPRAAAPASSEDSKAPPTAVTVKTVKPERKTLRRTIDQPGHIDAFETTPLYVKISGYVRKVHADIGDRVRKDDLLAELWVPELEEEGKQKEALIAQAKAEIDQARAAFQAAQANVETARALVRQAQAAKGRAQAEYDRWLGEHQRMEELVKRKVIDEQTRDETRNQFKAAEATREEVDARVFSAEAARAESAAKSDKAKADVSAAEARLQVAEANHRQVQALLQYAKVRSPFDGVVTQRAVDTGHLVQASSGGKTDPLFVVVRTDPVRVFVDVPESEAVSVYDGAAARVKVQVLRGQEFPGKVTRSSWALDTRSRTLRTEIDLPNTDGKLRPGMYAYASIVIERNDVLVLPATAIVAQGDQVFCFRVEDGKAVRTPLRIGDRDGKWIEVVKRQARMAKAGEEVPWEELAGNEEIVAEGVAGIVDGQGISSMRNP